ncbi:TetR/AcrR family transcriptional regulator [Actinotignum sanguinis]|uniref:TetR/AcrR family transcriptional regulator n=1 Tax=Actinotignum sanguinis TaxID=1445614 RepID=UPI00254E4605|nr:TetR/AcrR family transcriptional regulator [Actinotignum sanguinis]MDK8353019.1 TetR/AcrR family transcriptional regulator [Actinotignum sanguinis]
MRSPLRSHKKTGPKPTFTADEAIDAVFEIGLDRFTLGQVAEKLGVATSALYRLFKSREDLMEACLARVSSEYPPPEGESADALLRDYANKVWELMDTHPGLDLLFVQFSAPRVLLPRTSMPLLMRSKISPDGMWKSGCSR